MKKMCHTHVTENLKVGKTVLASAEQILKSGENNGAESIFEEILTKHFPKLMPQNEEVLGTPKPDKYRKIPPMFKGSAPMW